MSGRIRQHLPFIIVTAVLTAVMTFPTIVYVFRTDVFWLPAKHCCDAFIEFWDVWYGKLILTGQADLLYTNMIFYPEGVSLAYHPLFLLHSIVVNALQLFVPLSNAYSLTYLLIIFSSAFAAYVYLHWLFKDRWIALFGAVIFGFCPQAVLLRSFPAIAWLAPVPLIFYGVHRGISEKRANLIILAGLIAGLTSEVVPYTFVCILIMLALFLCGLAVSRWRDRGFWRHVFLLLAVIALSCAWRVIPMLQANDQLDRASSYTDGRVDLYSFFVHIKNPVLGPLAEDLLHIPEKPKISDSSYIGIVPIALICFGLFNKGKRRKILPWLGLLLVFLILSLGSTLGINGTEYESIKLPKHLLNQLLPPVFAAFHRPDFFMTGAWLPLAVLACLGLATLLDRVPIALRPKIALAFILIVAFEYYSPIPESVNPGLAAAVTKERLAFLDWLDKEEQSEINLINLPFGKHNSWRYSWFQSLSGYPQVEGYLSRTPSGAYDYIVTNFLLNAWHNRRPVHCEMTEKESFLSGLAQLEEDGFSHVVYHRDLHAAQTVSESFRNISPAYHDQYVSIYRLSDLREGCPDELSARHFFTSAYAEALGKGDIFDERHGVAVILPPTYEIADHFMRFLRYNKLTEKTVAVVSSDEPGTIRILSSDLVDLETENAVWLLDDRRYSTVDTPEASQAWFLARFKFCKHVYEDESTTIDLYLKLDISCAAMNESSALEVLYDGGLRLHNAYYEVASNEVRFYLAWSNDTEKRYAFSLQLFDSENQKVLQYDHPIWDDLLEVHKIDTTSLSEGAYSVRLIAYDFDTQVSQGGTRIDTTERFERELELAAIELET